MKIKSKFSRILGVCLTVIMLGSMLTTATPAVALSAATVTLNKTDVGAYLSSWDIRFTPGTAIQDAHNGGGNITVQWPVGFTTNDTSSNISVGDDDNGGNVTLAAGYGWVGASNWTLPVLTIVTTSFTSATRKFRLDLHTTDAIGADSAIRLVIPPRWVKNHSTPGNYTLLISTSNETTAVASANFTITLPNISPTAGTVTGKNSNGDILYQAVVSNLNTVIDTAAVSRIELGAGTYNHSATNTFDVANQTVVGVGAEGTVIITGGAAVVPVTVSATGVTIQNLVILGNRDGTAHLANVTANATFDGVTFQKGVNQLNISATSVQKFIVDNCTFEVTSNVSRGLKANDNYTSQIILVVTDSTFTVDKGGDAITNTANLSVSGSTFTGSGTTPDAILSSNGTSTVKNSTFTDFTRSFVISGNTSTATTNGTKMTVTGSTISGNGANTTSVSSGSIVCSGGVLIMTNNTIKDIGDYRFAIHASGGNISARFNTITGNTYNIQQTSGTANATLNYWGTTTGPAAATINATTAASVVTSPYLSVATQGDAGVSLDPTANLTSKDTAGVDIIAANGTMNFVVATKLAENPQINDGVPAVPEGTVSQYWDIYLTTTPSLDPSTITIKFYPSDTVTTDMRVYYGGGLTGAWTLADTQGVNLNSGYVYVTISLLSSPGYGDMQGTSFVVTSITPTPAEVALTGPVVGATDVPTNTPFSWTAISGATYDLQLSRSSSFDTLVADETGLTSSVYGLGSTLMNDTTYFWRVRSVLGDKTSEWVTSTFTTAAAADAAATTVTVEAPPPAAVTVEPITITPPAPAPVTVSPPQVTVEAPPPAEVTVEAAVVTVQAPPPAVVNVSVPEQQPVVPTYLLWTIILVGAVLVISLMVLIVRTRRVA